jgi:hypothetical protein
VVINMACKKGGKKKDNKKGGCKKGGKKPC